MSFQEVTGKLKAKLQKLLPAKSGASATAPAAQTPFSQLASIEKNTFVFGLDWRFYSDRKDLSQTLRAAKKDGVTHHVLTQSEDLVGIGRIPVTPKKTRLYSASLQLAQGISLGGMEMFVFQLGDDHFCLIALNESRPVIGFERTGTRSEILALAGEFQLAQMGHNIRQVGNTGTLEHEEHVKISEAFARPDDISRIKAIPDYTILFIAIAVILTLGMLANYIYGYFNAAQIKETERKAALERDPNYIYEKEIDAGMQAVGSPAQVQLDRWRTTIKDIPTVKKGWTLTAIECQPAECRLYWRRNFGSYVEFFSASQAYETKSIENQEANNPAASFVQTILAVPPSSSAPVKWTREKLSALTDIQRPLASQLQDFSLLPNSTVVLKAPELFPAKAGMTAQQIEKPVIRGEWALTHDIWTLNDLSFTLPGLTLESINIIQTPKSDQWTYTLKGLYYAKGKKF